LIVKFDSVGSLEQLVWASRLADLPRSEDRAVLQRLYGGKPPFEEDKAEENNVEINRNDLTGVNLLAQARRQWNNAFLGTKNYFNVTLDSGPKNKRSEWGGIITRNINTRLKRNPRMREQIRATGANVMLHGIGPVNWPDRRSPIPVPLPISSLMISSETDIDFENLEWFSVFREWTPSQLYDMCYGSKVDPGWNLPAVKRKLRDIADEQQKLISASAYQYMPERVEELIKQDKGYWGSDAVPTIDVWDTYFREAEDGKGWYRRIFLDWGITESGMREYQGGEKPPKTKNEDGFLYSSKDKKYANSLSEILHCQFGDTSAYAPFKYHSVRSLGWMLWGPCELQNRLYCKTMEQAFMQLMWWFRVPGESAFARLQQAQFRHLGVIPNGVTMISSAERYSPDAKLIELAYDRNKQLMSDNSSSFTQDFSGSQDKAMTATETMARVNTTNALVSGMLALAYDYEEPKYREISRRFCIKNNPDKDVREFRRLCLKEGVPEEMLDVERWNVSAERVVGGGNKTIEMAAVQFLQGMRKNLNPTGQRIVDHMSVFAATDQPDLAEEIAPMGDIKELSNSAHNAELATERMMRGLPYDLPKDAVAEDFIIVWLRDLTVLIGQITQKGGMATQDEIVGLSNIASHVAELVKQMEQNPEDKERTKQYADALGKIQNAIKGFAQRLVEQRNKQNGKQQGVNGVDPETATKLKGKLMIDQAKAANLRESHAIKTAQKEVSFESKLRQDERRHNAELRQEAQKNALETASRLRAFQE